MISLQQNQESAGGGYQVGEKDNQHFVPKFYFRFFSEGEERIHLFYPRKNLLIKNAPIKGQCARHRMYGDNGIEDILCEIEGRHRTALKGLIDYAWRDGPSPLTPERFVDVMQAVQFQRRRTQREAERIASNSNSLTTLAFTHWLKHQPYRDDRDEILKRIQDGEIHITKDSKGLFLESIASSLMDAQLVTDLGFCIIKNVSWFPFVFCDAPVVFHNSYYQNVRSRGVLGLTTPGLQIFYPLDSRTMLILFDTEVYRGRIEEKLLLNVDDPDDVCQLNLLQFHNHSKTIYCGNPLDLGYAQTMWRNHRHTIGDQKPGVVVRRGWLVDGKPVPEAIQCYEPMHDIRLDLSFMRCWPIAESQFVPRRRNPAAYKLFKARQQKLERKKQSRNR